MKFGHHGANHPVYDVSTQNIYISSQNHGFAVDLQTLPDDYKARFISLFDHTLQGIQHRHKPFFGFQGHPESSPGPNELRFLFDEFVQLIYERAQHAKAS